jgi:hypothetical protein
VSSEEALSVSLLLGAISVIIGLVGGVIWLASPERGSYAAAKAANAAEEAPGYGLGKEASSHP